MVVQTNYTYVFDSPASHSYLILIEFELAYLNIELGEIWLLNQL